MPPSSISAALSVDLLVQIIDRLPDPADRKSIRLVSRAFLFAECLQRKELKVLRRQTLGLLLRRYEGVERLDLSRCAALDDAALAAALGGGATPAVREVRLSRASGVGWKGLAAMAAACRRLEIVDLSHCVGFGDREAAALAAVTGLKELKLDKCLKFTDVGLAKVAVGCPGLEKLGIKWCLEISDLGIDLLAKKCRGLKVLDISYLKITNESLRSISTLPKIEDLKMVGCYYLTDECLGYLKNGKNSLRIIDVSRSNCVTSSGLVSVIEGHKYLQKLKAGDCFLDLAPAFLSKLRTLTNAFRVLKLDGCEVSASSLKMIGGNCKNLTKIGLSKCRGVTDEGVSELVSSCASLEKIDLTCCRQLTDDSFFTIANSCKKLESLLIESCSLITEKGIDRIGSYCSNLHEIDLTDCNIDDTALKSLSKCQELVQLKLGLCTNISDRGLAYIGSKCRKLQELDLYRCIAVGDNGLAALASGCKKLRSLNLCYCTLITDQGMKHISALEELKDLELRGLTQVTSLGIMAISIGCPNLLELDMKRCYSVDDVGFLALAEYSAKLRQLNISYCRISEQTLGNLLGNLRCLQDAKLVHLTEVSKQGLEMALRTCLNKLKKLKLLGSFRHLVSPYLLQILQAHGCRIRWVEKPLRLP